MATIENVYIVENDGGTYRAYNTSGVEVYSGTNLVTDVLGNRTSAGTITGDNATGNFSVLFGAGTFDMGTSNWVIASAAASYALSDILIAGQGPESTILQNSSTAAADTEVISCTRARRVTVRDMTISAGGTDRTTSDALDFDDCDGVLIERVRVTDSRGDGIVFDGKDSGATFVGGIIRDCEILGSGTIPNSGIVSLSTTETMIIGNRINGCGESGIKLNRQFSTTTDTRRCVVMGNICTDNTESGIEIISSSYNVIVGNVCMNNGQGAGTWDDGITIDWVTGETGLEPTANVITGNVLCDDQGTATQSYGLRIPDSQTTETVVVGNSFDRNVTAPILNSGTRTLIRSNSGLVENVAREVATNTTVDVDDPGRVWNADTASGTVQFTLPDNAASSGRAYIFHRDGATNNATVVRAGTDTFDDAATTKTLGSDGAAIGIFSIGDGEWKIVSTEGTVT